MRVTNLIGTRWFITFIDDHTRIHWVYLRREKSEVKRIFKEFHNMVKTHFQTEFQYHSWPFLKRAKHDSSSSCIGTLEQNGIIECKNRHLLKVARAIRFAMGVPKYLWSEAALKASYLINRMPTRILKFQTPLHLFLKYLPQTRIINSLPFEVFRRMIFAHV